MITQLISDEDAEKKEVLVNFKEIDRLAYVVRSIEMDCSLVPVGAYRLTTSHELRYNDSFNGLSTEEANNLKNF